MNQEPDRQRPAPVDFLGAKAWAATAALEEFRGQSAAWFRYMLGHRAFTLLVGNMLGPGNVLLHFEVCQFIAGPVEWILREPVIRWYFSTECRDIPRRWFEMRDDPAGFHLSAMTLHWARDQRVAGYDEAAVEIERAERERINYGLPQRPGDDTR